MKPIGHLADDGTTLVLVRTLPVSIDDAWASLTESDRLARWFGTWTGDPSTGSVMVSMNAEAEPASPVRYDIEECEPPRLLTVRAVDDYGHWRLTAELTESDSSTTFELRQTDIDPQTLADTGPGWEWYLDRLVAATTGDRLPTLDDFETTYVPMGGEYSALADHL